MPPKLLPAGKFHDPDGINLGRTARIAQSGLRLPPAKRDNDDSNDVFHEPRSEASATSSSPPAEGNVQKQLQPSPDEDYPIYLELRLQLVFGEPPCRDTVASYWVGVSRGRMEAVMDFVAARCSDWEGEWNILPHVPE